MTSRVRLGPQLAVESKGLKARAKARVEREGGACLHARARSRTEDALSRWSDVKSCVRMGGGGVLTASRYRLSLGGSDPIKPSADNSLDT